MAEKSIISWTDRTWNPWRGCTKISPGCTNCYMFTAQERYGRDPKKVERTKTWGDPVRWQKEAAAAGRTDLVFTCSWSDWFHADADAWRDEAWAVIKKCPNLNFQVLTKRSERIADHLPADWGPQGYPNVWLGVSVENKRYGLPRIDHLRTVPAVVRFLSVEPLLEDLGTVNLTGIDWVLVGGESGPGYRHMDHAWAISLRDQCKAAGVAFHFKQSSAPRTEMGVELEGRIIREYPTPRIALPLAGAGLFD
jgi:protein gp37